MPSPNLIRTVGWTTSIGLHGAIFALLLSANPSLRQAPQRTEVAFSVVTTANATSTAAPAQASNTATSTRTVARSTGRTAPRAVAPRQVSAPQPVDLTGVTLTGVDGATWSSVTGNGQAMVAPIAKTTVATRQPETIRLAVGAAARPQSHQPPLVVPVTDLATRPVPPVLDAQLLANYPSEARRLGIAGRAVVIARVDADGVVRTARIFSESSAGFGAACQRTLLGTRWTEPRDKEGRSVQTQLYYTCDFRVDG